MWALSTLAISSYGLVNSTKQDNKLGICRCVQARDEASSQVQARDAPAFSQVKARDAPASSQVKAFHSTQGL